MKKAFFISCLFLFFGVISFAQNRLFWYPDSCLTHDLNAILDSYPFHYYNSVQIDETHFEEDSVQIEYSIWRTKEEGLSNKKTTHRSNYSVVFKPSLDSLNRLILATNTRSAYFFIGIMNDCKLDNRNPIFYETSFNRSQKTSSLIINKRGVSNLSVVQIDSLNIKTEWVNSYGPYILDSWHYSPLDSVYYHHFKQEIGGKNEIYESDIQFFAPVNWEIFQQQIIATNFVTLSHNFGGWQSHGLTTTVEIWSNGGKYFISYYDNELTAFDFLKLKAAE